MIKTLYGDMVWTFEQGAMCRALVFYLIFTFICKSSCHLACLAVQLVSCRFLRVVGSERAEMLGGWLGVLSTSAPPALADCPSVTTSRLHRDLHAA